MTNLNSTFARFCAVPVVAAGIIGGAALGLAGIANATPTPTTTAPSGPGYQYYPDTYAKPVPTQAPGWNMHHGPNHMN